MNRIALYLSLTLIVLLTTTPPVLPERTGPVYTVTRVVDGDTVVVRHRGKTEKVRLLHVDTPESVHPDPARNSSLGKAASAYTRSRLLGKQVSLAFGPERRGRYGRLLAYVILDGINVNLELVRRGWSPYYTKYGKSRTLHNEFTAAQRMAKSNAFNIWAPASGYDRKKPKPGKSITVSGEGFRGNTRSKVFHRPSCRHFNCTRCTAVFKQRDTAVNAGYRPCGICRP